MPNSVHAKYLDILYCAMKKTQFVNILNLKTKLKRRKKNQQIIHQIHWACVEVSLPKMVKFKMPNMPLNELVNR